MACEYIKVTDKYGRDRLEDLNTNPTINVQSGDIIFINELTNTVNIEILNDGKDLLITFSEGNKLTLENIVELLGNNFDEKNIESSYDELLTKLQFLNDMNGGEITYTQLSDIYNLLDSAAARPSELLEDNNVTNFGDVISDNKGRDFRRDNDNEVGEFDLDNIDSLVDDSTSQTNTVVLDIEIAEITKLITDINDLIITATASIYKVIQATSATKTTKALAETDPTIENIAAAEAAKETAEAAAVEATEVANELAVKIEELRDATTGSTNESISELIASAEVSIVQATTAAQEATEGVEKAVVDEVTEEITEVTDIETIDTVEEQVDVNIPEDIEENFIFEEDVILDFDNLASESAANIETPLVESLEDIDLNDVMSMTRKEDNIILDLIGDGGENIGLEEYESTLVKQDKNEVTDDGEEFTVWTNNDVKVFIDDDVTTSDI